MCLIVLSVMEKNKGQGVCGQMRCQQECSLVSHQKGGDIQAETRMYCERKPCKPLEAKHVSRGDSKYKELE